MSDQPGPSGNPNERPNNSPQNQDSPFNPPNAQPLNPYAAQEMPTGWQGGGPAIQPQRTLVGQVPVVAILSFVVASFEFILSVGMLVVSTIILATGNAPDGTPADSEDTSMAVVLLVLGTIVLGISAFRIIAGIQFMKYRNRTLFIVSICVGLISVFTCYCSLFSLGICIYGLIVALNPGVTQACRMGQAGMSPADIRRHFPF